MSQSEAQPTRIVSTRIAPPTIAGALVARVRLIDLLRAGHAKKLAFVHAPAGYGKTTLAVQWQRELLADGVSVAWLSLDRDDNDAVNFLAHLVEAVRRADPTLAADLGEHLEQLSGDATRFVLTELVNQISRRARPLVVVLDDWHLITDDETAAALEFLLKVGPDNLRMIVTSRTRAPAVGWLKVRDQVTELDAAQLRFDRTESASFLLDLNALQLDPTQVHSLWTSTDGWVAALQLVSLSLRNTHDPSALIAGFSGRHHSVGDYLAENVLDALPADLLDFLLTTSVCDRLCADLATAVSGQPRGQAVLEQLEHHDMFLRPLDDHREWFRYHHLFADYLRQRLARDHGDRIPGLHRAASAWFADRGLLSEAVTHALAAGDDDVAVDLVEDQAMSLVEHSRMASLLGLVQKLPQAQLPARPHLQMAVAWANCLLQRATAAENALGHARSALASATDDASTALLGEADVVQACVDVYGDRIDRAAGLVAPCLQDTSRHRPFLVAVSANIRTFVDIHTFGYDTAQSRQEWATVFHEGAGGPFAGVYGRCFAGLAAFAQLDLTTAAARYHEARVLAQTAAGPHSHAARLAGALVGRLAYENGDIDSAETLLEECHELGAESGVADFMIATYTTLARVKLLRGDVDSALALLDEGTAAASRLALVRLAAALDAERVRLHVHLDDVAAADAVARRAAGSYPGAGGDGVAMAVRHYRVGMQADVARARRKYGEAAELLSATLQEARDVGWRYAEMTHTVDLARIAMVDGRRDAAAALLAPALAAGSRCGLVRVFVDSGPEPLQIVAGLREAGRTDRWPAALPRVPADYLSKLLAVAHADAGHDAVGGSRAVPHGPLPEGALTVREVEILRLLERGLPNKQIARTLGVTVNTVKWYLKSTYVKLGVTNRGQAVAEARRRDILS